MKKIIKIIFFLLLSKAVFACIIDQLVAETNNGVSWPTEGPTWGQSFVACESGTVWEIAFWPNYTTTGLHTLILTDINCVTMWTVSNINLPGTGNQIIVDLSTGSGSSRTVTSGTAYVFQLIGPAGSNIQINLSWNNPYLAGADKTFGCNSYGLDWWFRVGINEGLGNLPVELSEFHANLDRAGTAVELNFKTESEVNASHFEIEHSADGEFYQDIGRIKAKGTSSETQSYNFVHQDPSYGNNYYRLKQVDDDGSFEYSKVVSAMVESRKFILIISPNPTVGNINVFYDVPSGRNLVMELLNLDGKLLYRQVLQEGKMNNSIDGSSFSPGVYYLNVSENGMPVWADKIIKQ